MNSFGRTIGQDGAGLTTNNESEYDGVEHVLMQAVKMRPKKLLIKMDSKLCVQQLTTKGKRWRCDSKKLQPRQRRCLALIRTLQRNGTDVTLEWIKRADNSEADALAAKGGLMDADSEPVWEPCEYEQPSGDDEDSGRAHEEAVTAFRAWAEGQQSYSEQRIESAVATAASDPEGLAEMASGLGVKQIPRETRRRCERQARALLAEVPATPKKARPLSSLTRTAGRNGVRETPRAKRGGSSAKRRSHAPSEDRDDDSDDSATDDTPAFEKNQEVYAEWNHVARCKPPQRGGGERCVCTSIATIGRAGSSGSGGPRWCSDCAPKGEHEVYAVRPVLELAVVQSVSLDPDDAHGALYSVMFTGEGERTHRGHKTTVAGTCMQRRSYHLRPMGGSGSADELSDDEC